MTVKLRRSPTYHSFEQWKEIIEDWGKSGLSIHAYCVQKGLVETSFYSWKKKLIQSPSSSQAFPDIKKGFEASPNFPLKDFFIPITGGEEAPISPSSSNQKIEVVFAQGHRLCLEGPFDWAIISLWLAPLLEK